MGCEICPRSHAAGSAYCRYHKLAFDKLKDAFVKWELAYGSLVWERYLESVSELADSGDWVRDIARNELNRLK